MAHSLETSYHAADPNLPHRSRGLSVVSTLSYKQFGAGFSYVQAGYLLIDAETEGRAN
jgi:hypothetical protein